MAGVNITKPLLAFAFLAEEFEKTNDIVQGLLPIFRPILARRVGQMLEPAEVADDLSQMYGLRVHPWIIEDWLDRLESLGLVRAVKPSPGTISYECLAGSPSPEIDESQVKGLIETYKTFATRALDVAGVNREALDLEAALLERLERPEFLGILLKPDSARKPVKGPHTLSLTKQSEDSAARNLEAQLDVVTADFILNLADSSPALFDLLVQIASGALLAEAVLVFQAPQNANQLKGVTAYLDGPFIMDVLGLGFKEQSDYAKEVFDQLKAAGVRLVTFELSIEEIRSNLNGPLDRHARGELAFGPTGSRLFNQPFRTYAIEVLASTEKHVRDLGIQISKGVNSASAYQYFSADEEQDLRSHIGDYHYFEAQQRDASAIAQIIRIRQRQDRPMTSFSMAKAFFLTRNARLADMSTRHLRRRGVISDRGVPAALSDRYLSGLLWLTLGGKGPAISKLRLLANCASAVGPRADVIARMHGFLEQIDENTARYFDALMTNEKAAHYLTSRTLGTATLVTRDNAIAIYEEVERIAGEKAAREAEKQWTERQAEFELRLRAKQAEIELLGKEREAKIGEARSENEASIARANAELTSLKLELEKATSQHLLESGAKALLHEQLEEQVRTSKLLQNEISARQKANISRAELAGKAAARRAKVGVIAVLVLATLIAAIAQEWKELLNSSLGSTLTSVGLVLLPTAIFFLTVWLVPELIFGKLLSRVAHSAFDATLRDVEPTLAPKEWEYDWRRNEFIRVPSTADN